MRLHLNVRALLRALCVVSLFVLVPSAHAAQTVVSLEFDDGWADHYQAGQMMSLRGMQGTFFIISGQWGFSNYMTPEQVQDLAAHGHEIAGHTVDHPDLTTLSADDVAREICDDRVSLSGLGLPITDFAYPYGATNAAVIAAVQACGYNSARGVGGLRSGTSCQFCDPSEPIPPPNLWKTRTPDPVMTGTTLADLESYVTQAENSGGGWVQLVFHHVCDACDAYSVTAPTLASFLDWLQLRNVNGTVVRTVHQVIGGSVKPLLNGPPVAPPGDRPNLLLNPSLEQDANGDSVPDCFQQSGYGSNTATFSRVTDAHTGSAAERLDITSYTSGDAKLVTKQDKGTCAPKVIPGHSYDVHLWYRSNVPSGIVAFARSTDNSWSYFGGSSNVPASAGWAEATWTTPPIPAGFDHLSFGLAFSSVGSITTDDYYLADSDQTPPTVGLVSPGGESTVNKTVGLVASASDLSGIDHVDLLVDGDVVGTATSAPYSVSWNSASVADGLHTVSARAVDTAGNEATTAGVVVDVDNTAPSSTVACNASNCKNGPYSVSVAVSLAASDADSGVAAIRYTLDGSDPDTLNGTTYTAPFTLSATTTVRYRAYDAAGNAEAIHTRTVQVAGPPGVALTAPADGDFVGGSVMLGAGASADAGIDHVDFLVDGSVVGSDSSAPYTGTWNSAAAGDGAHTVLAVATDTLGATTQSATRTVHVDNTAPVTSIGCEGGPCGSAPLPAPVHISLSASAGGGSPIAAIKYTLDGTDPTISDGTIYSNPFVLLTTTEVRYRAFDSAGNAEPVRSRTVVVDAAAPAVALTAPSAGAAVGGSAVPLAASASDDTGVDHVTFLVDGSPVAISAVEPFSATWDTTLVTDGAHQVTAIATDDVGRAGTSDPVTVTVDNTAPTSSIACNGAACAAAAYTAPVSVSLSGDDGSGSGIAAIVYSRDGSTPDLATGTPYTAPFSVAATSTVKWRAYDQAGNAEAVHSTTITISIDTAPPTVSLTAPAAGATVRGSVPLAATAGDDQGIDHVNFLVDGSPTGAPDTSAPYTASWDSTSVADGDHQLAAVATDTAGTSTTSTAVTVHVDNTPPTSSIACNGSACSASTYSAAVTVTLSGNDGSGSGLDRIVYTTNGTTPDLGNGTTYTTPFSLPATATVKWRAFDHAGNAETVHTTTITITIAGPPTVSLTAPDDGSTVRGAVALSATAAADAGIDHVTFLVDGSPSGTPDTSAPYAASWDSTSVADGDHQLAAVATDTADRSTTSTAITVHVDNTAPQSAMLCNGSACSASAYSAAVTVTLSANDGTGSGVDKIVYTTNGTTPDLGNGTTYTTPVSLPATATVKWRAFDHAGNAEAVHATTVTITIPGPPTVSLTAPADGATVRGAVPLSATASADSGVDHVTFLVDGSPTGNPDTSAPYTANWASTSVAEGDHQLAAVATDTAGRSTTSTAITVHVDNTPPTSSIACNGSACAAAAYTAPVSVSLSADDGTGSGIATIVYSTDGSTPDQATGTPYTTPFTVSATTTVKWRAYDHAGNAEAVHSMTVTITITGPPTVSLTAPADGATVRGAVALAATAAGGSGIDHVTFLVDGSPVAISSVAPYSATWDTTLATDGTHQLTAIATDNGGRSTTSTAITVHVDNTAPTSSIACNGAACAAAAYTAPVSVSLSGDDGTGSGIATIVYSSDGSTPDLATGTPYTAPFPVAATSTVKWRAYDQAGNAEAVHSTTISIDTAPPTVSLTAPAAGATVRGSVPLSATAADDRGIDHVTFLVDGAPTGTPDTNPPYAASWASTSVAEGDHQLAAVATDTAGRSTTSTAITVHVDNTPPTSSIACNGSACSASAYSAAVTVTLSASDGSGSGLDRIVYTTNGTTPDLGNGTTYTTPFSLPATATVKWRAFDHAGNAEAVHTTTITISLAAPDRTPPTTTISCNAAVCATSYYTAAVQVGLSATDGTGSGVAHVRYTLDGTAPTLTNGIEYSTPFSVAATTTVKYRAYDVAGNAEATKSAKINIDLIAPTTTVQCNAKTCTSGWYTSVTVKLTGKDTGGSGLASVRYTTDGSDPTPTNGTTYAAPFVVGATSDLRYRAFDAAGNAEPVHLLHLQVDGAAPTVAISSPAGGATIPAPATITLTADASDAGSGVVSVRFYADGVAVAAADTTAPYTASWKLKAANRGTHTLTAVATDAAGNVTTSAPVVVTVS